MTPRIAHTIGKPAALLLAALCATWVLGAGDETRPARLPPSRPLGAAYRILLTRSIFARDHRAAVISPRFPTASVGPDTRPAIASEDYTSPMSENNITLRGISWEDGEYVAFFEDSVGGQSLRVRVGEPVSHGRIAAMTLDGIDYKAGGKSNRILIGQSLAGGVFVAATTQPTTNPAPASPSGSGSLTGDKPKWWRH